MSGQLRVRRGVQVSLTPLRLERDRSEGNCAQRSDAYITELDDEIAPSSSAFVGAAVTEVATLRASSSDVKWVEPGPLAAGVRRPLWSAL